MKYGKLFIFVYIPLLISFLATGFCSCSPIPKLDDIYFPVQEEVPKYILISPLRGDLVLKNGYLRVDDELVLWPYGFSLKIEDRKIWIIDAQGMRFTRVGDYVRLSGGEIPKFFAEEKLGHSLPENCKVPYFLVGRISSN